VLLLLFLVLADADLLLIAYEKFGKDTSSLSGKVVWVTGASSGIGEEMAYHLARAGCRVVVSARRAGELERVKQACVSQGAREDHILVLPLDVIDFDRHKEAVSTVLEHFGQIDILVNNAGRSQMAEWQKVELAVDRNLFEINVLGPVSLTREVLPHMTGRGAGGHIVVVSSIAGKIGLPGAPSYTGSKHAVHGYFEGLRNELSAEGIEVTLICPGPVFSQLYRQAATNSADKSLNREMESTEKRMPAQRCAYLSCVAIANQVSETWIAPQPILLSAYVIQYAPVLGRWIFKKFGARQMMKFREGK